MNCPVCNSDETRTARSWTAKTGEFKRTHKCLFCGATFRTREVLIGVEIPTGETLTPGMVMPRGIERESSPEEEREERSPTPPKEEREEATPQRERFRSSPKSGQSAVAPEMSGRVKAVFGEFRRSWEGRYAPSRWLPEPGVRKVIIEALEEWGEDGYEQAMRAIPAYMADCDSFVASKRHPLRLFLGRASQYVAKAPAASMYPKL